ncbi:hypothetical protein [Marilutibacter aestuarii]|uniref:Sugar transporter n=1 Tax=Marilutibacter aestuarii TaxID=1706195 RepID=A0A508AV84_9GAMM|nr:hypothetical protein [Lysobacter aestuarii]TQD50975.1 hypothetical protein FKV25_02965 [Lysobacter aestuarii]
MTISSKPSRVFWVVGALALAWNLVGVATFIGQVTMSPATLAALPPDQQALYAQMPAWVEACYAAAVFGGALGALALLLRKRIAMALFLLSAIGAVLQFGGVFALTDAYSVLGPSSVVMPVVIIVVCVALWLYARRCTARGWLG